MSNDQEHPRRQRKSTMAVHDVSAVDDIDSFLNADSRRLVVHSQAPVAVDTIDGDADDMAMAASLDTKDVATLPPYLLNHNGATTTDTDVAASVSSKKRCIDVDIAPEPDRKRPAVAMRMATSNAMASMRTPSQFRPLGRDQQLAGAASQVAAATVAGLASPIHMETNVASLPQRRLQDTFRLGDGSRINHSRNPFTTGSLAHTPSTLADDMSIAYAAGLGGTAMRDRMQNLTTHLSVTAWPPHLDPFRFGYPLPAQTTSSLWPELQMLTAQNQNHAQRFGSQQNAQRLLIAPSSTGLLTQSNLHNSASASRNNVPVRETLQRLPWVPLSREFVDGRMSSSSRETASASTILQRLMASRNMSQERATGTHSVVYSTLTRDQLLRSRSMSSEAPSFTSLSQPRSLPQILPAEDLQSAAWIPSNSIVPRTTLPQARVNTGNQNTCLSAPFVPRLIRGEQQAHPQILHLTTNATLEASQPNVRIAAAAALSTTGLTLPALLSRPSDAALMSEHQAFMRQQVQAFVATELDVHGSTRGRNQRLRVGQVGIQCRHCAHIWPMVQRGIGTCYFPSHTLGIYQAAQNMSTMHLQRGLCPAMPDDIKQRFVDLIPTKNVNSKVGRKYWSDCAIAMGLVNTEDGIFFIHDLLSTGDVCANLHD